jgi:hypothetical protein
MIFEKLNYVIHVPTSIGNEKPCERKPMGVHEKSELHYTKNGKQ